MTNYVEKIYIYIHMKHTVRIRLYVYICEQDQNTVNFAKYGFRYLFGVAQAHACQLLRFEALLWAKGGNRACVRLRRVKDCTRELRVHLRVYGPKTPSRKLAQRSLGFTSSTFQKLGN